MTGGHGRWLLPIFFFLSSQILLSVVASRTGFNPLTAETWIRRDSGFYLDIAQNGYTLSPCPGESNDSRCGNAGWFPGYPWLIRAAQPPLGARLAAIALTLLGLLVLFSAIARFAGRRMRDVAPLLVISSIFPGMVYFHAVFPIALCALFLFLYVIAARANNLSGCALSALVASVIYPTGALLPLCLIPYTLTQWRGGQLDRPALSALARHAPAVLGLLTVAAVQHQQTGSWDAFFKVQSKYRLAGLYPLQTFGLWLGGLKHVSSHLIAVVPPLQTAALALLLLWLTWQQFEDRRSESTSSFENWILVAGWVYFLFPYLRPARIAFYRSEALLLPMVVWLLRGRPRTTYAFAVVFACISVPMAGLFFKDWLN